MEQVSLGFPRWLRGWAAQTVLEVERPCTGRGHWVPGAQGAAESREPQNLYPGLGLDTHFARLPGELLPPPPVHALYPSLEKVCGTGVLEARECGTKSEGSGLRLGLARGQGRSGFLAGGPQPGSPGSEISVPFRQPNPHRSGSSLVLCLLGEHR